MIEFDIKSLGNAREHNKLEAKSARGGIPGSFWETYSAFANTDGGISTGGNEQDIEAMLELYAVENHEVAVDIDTNRAKAELKSDSRELKPDNPELISDNHELKSGDTELKLRLIEILRGKPKFSYVEIGKELGMHRSSVQRRLNALVKEGRIRHIGPRNGGSWEVIE